MSELRIFSGRSNDPLARAVARYIDEEKISAKVATASVLGMLDPRRNFGDGETYARIAENVRGCDVFIIQSTNQPEAHLKELGILVYGAKLASARRVTAVIPYLGYARQDWKDKSRAPISVAYDIRCLREAAGVDRVLLLDVHSNVSTGAFAALLTPNDHLWARPAFVRYLREHESEWRTGREFVVAAADVHADRLARAYARDLDAASWIVVDKIRPRPGETEVAMVIGDVSGKDAILVDDMIDSGNTIINDAKALKELGALDISVVATHPVLSRGAVTKLHGHVASGLLKKVFVTDSIFHPETPDLSSYGITVVTVSRLLGEAIWRTHTNESVSSLFDTE